MKLSTTTFNILSMTILANANASANAASHHLCGKAGTHHLKPKKGNKKGSDVEDKTFDMLLQRKVQHLLSL
jgi:hypothetical protein